MSDREKLIALLEGAKNSREIFCSTRLYCSELIADHLISNGVCLETKQSTSEKTSDESKRIEELEAELAKQEETVVQLRKQWQEAEMLICTMCGHFDHKTDGNIVCGNRTCGEICGYPYCKAKFTMWIPVSERLPEDWEDVLVLSQFGFCETAVYLGIPGKWRVTWNYELLEENSVTHWMQLPELPKECE